MATATAGGAAKPGKPPARKKPVIGGNRWVAVLFLIPALVLLGALVLYPIVYSVVRSLFDAGGSAFVGLENYGEVFTEERTLTAFRNTAIWVAVAPTVATALGLIFAVLTERVSWGTAFKLLIFMPMAISMLASGIIFRLVYEQDPDRGVANAVMVGVHDTFAESSAYPGARPQQRNSDLAASGGGALTTKSTYEAGSPVSLPLLAIKPTEVADAEDAKAAPDGDGITGTVWLDFKPGGGGDPGTVDSGEKGLSGVRVEAVRDGEVVASARTGGDGTFSIPADQVEGGAVQLRLPASNFAEPYAGVNWLGPTLVTPAIIAAYIWMWAGFAMVLIAAGLASVPRELLEAARVDGANEWKVFTKVTVPLLAPVLVVVLVTLMINVMKIFDLVYIIAPGSTQADANVLALELYLQSFGAGNNQGVGSAIGVILLLLVLPVMYVNIRRMRRERRR